MKKLSVLRPIIYYQWITVAILLVFILGQIPKAYAQWNPHAGYVPSYTIGAVVSTSSVGNGNIAHIVDGDPNTNWVSDAPLPTNYISRADQNFLYHQANTLFSSSGTIDLINSTDADLNTNTPTILLNGMYAHLTVSFANPQALLLTSIKANATAPIELYSFTSPIDSILVGTYDPNTQNFNLERYNLGTGNFTQLKLYSTSSFSVFEWAAIHEPPKEYVTIDFGSPLSIGQIITRHWAGVQTATATELLISNDQQTWTPIASLYPDALQSVTTILNQEIFARYLKLEQSLVLEDFKNTFIWEVAAYDKNGIYGEAPPTQPSTITVSDLLGVNGIWGWGHNQYSNLLNSGEGPTLYNTISSHARNYHFMNWDVTDPDITPDYTTMASGGGTQALWWLNWDQEYQAWSDANMDIITSIQFSTYADTDWDTPFQSAYNYGFAFANHFGASNGNGLVPTIEVGNEPWMYDSLVYKNILAGMAAGAKIADPFMRIFPCALQAHNPFAEHNQTGFRHYMGSRIPASVASFIDGINVHAYSFINDEMGEQIATYPEHPASEMRSVYNVLRFRNQNLPNKEVILTEWGWDSDSANEDCTHSECVSENEAAAYVVRAALWWLKLGLDKATYFFYGNTPEPSFLFKRSGLTESTTHDFAKKKTMHNFQNLVDSLGNHYFIDAPIESDSAWLYLLGDEHQTVTHLVAWRPIDASDTSTKTVFWTGDYSPVSATLLDGSIGGTPIPLPVDDGNTMQLQLQAMPMLLTLCPRDCIDGLHLSSNTIFDKAYRVINYISSDALLPNNGSILFQAGDSIRLQQGFEIPLGTQFEAVIEDCQ